VIWWLLACGEREDTEPVPLVADRCAELDADALSFGAVAVASSEPRSLTLSNPCAGALLAERVWVDPPEGFTAELRGEPSIADGRSSEIVVTFTPGEVRPYAATLHVETDDPHHPELLVTLDGSGSAPLADVPASVDLGEVWIGCEAEAAVTVSSVGTEDLVVTGLTASSELVPDNEWSALGPLAPGASAELAVASWTPLSLGSLDATVTLTTNDPLRPERAVAVTGEAVRWRDAIVISEGVWYEEADLLLVVDDSEVEDAVTYNLAGAIETLVRELPDDGWRIGVITTSSSTLRGEPVTPDDPDPEAALLAQLPTEPGGGTAGMDAAYAALPSFPRDGAVLTVLFVTDDADTSAVLPEELHAAALDLVGGREDLLRMHAIAGKAPAIEPWCEGWGIDPGVPLDELVALAGGRFHDACEGDFDGFLWELAPEILPRRHAFWLGDVAVRGTIVVYVDGVLVTEGWEYDAGANSVAFEEGHAPENGAVVEIRFEVLPDCP
jgi:hypothetical protein